MGPEEAIIDMLLSDSAVTGLAGSRVYPVSRPQGTHLPAVTIQRISGPALYSDEGEVGLENPRYQIDAWGTTYAEAKELSRAIKSVLSAFDGDHEGVSFKFIEFDAERDMRESGSNQTKYPFRVSADYAVWIAT